MIIFLSENDRDDYSEKEKGLIRMDGISYGIIVIEILN